MKQLVLSDLHLGARSDADLLRRADVREPLLAALDDVDRLVLLGDALELRDGPAHEPLAAGRALFEDLGRTLGPDRELVIVPGNHDHQLIAPWLEARRRVPDAPRLGLEQWAGPEASPLAQVIDGWLGSTPLRLAYPGLFLREDVYATHGHYLDVHVAVPSFERMSARVVERWVRRGNGALGPVEAYEGSLAPIYALLYTLAQTAPEQGRNLVSGASGRAWRILVGDGGRRPLGHIALGAIGFPAAIWTLNRMGLGPLRSELSGVALRRAGLEAMAEVVERLRVPAEYVLFGHTHRSGPWPGDEESEWVAPGGARMVNVGSWMYERLFISGGPGRNPYWPGNVGVVDDNGPPRLRGLLRDRSQDDLRQPTRA
ncbi:MAG: metallophosphoesterase [Solirubrobacteraceae bacterium]